jgi:hypothetical protein
VGGCRLRGRLRVRGGAEQRELHSLAKSTVKRSECAIHRFIAVTARDLDEGISFANRGIKLPECVEVPSGRRTSDGMESKSLTKLLESAELLRMVEDLLNPALGNGSPPSSLAGVRITLRNVREAILTSHDALAAERAHRPAEQEGSTRAPEPPPAPNAEADHEELDQSVSERALPFLEAGRLVMGHRRSERTDLRSSIEKIIGR